jgi:membrane protease YdiL (CAAX protease family)
MTFSLTKSVPFLILIIVLMKEVKAKEIRRRVRKEPLSRPGLPFTRINYWLFALGIAVIVVGYIALAQPATPPTPKSNSFWSLTVAPILLIIGYCIIIPIAILYQKKKTLEPTNGR